MSDHATPDQQCLDDIVCRQIYQWTDNAWLAEGGYFLLVRPLKVALIILIAVAVRALLNHTIKKIVDRAASGTVSTALRPLRDKMPVVTQDGFAVPERRRQRAEAIGSVLRSFVTFSVFSIAFLLILDEFGINLGPLIASLGIVGVALGFGAQTLVKDLIAGLFMLLEDQYGVGDVVDTGEAIGVVESVGLRTITIRDTHGVIWYVRNGEIVRIGNKSQGWAKAIVDVPIGFADVRQATVVLDRALALFAAEQEYAGAFVEQPEVLGVEQMTVDGTVLRAACKTTPDRHREIQRELRRRIFDALNEAGITAQLQASRQPRTPAAE